jgi:hypothetical protein
MADDKHSLSHPMEEGGLGEVRVPDIAGKILLSPILHNLSFLNPESS